MFLQQASYTPSFGGLGLKLTSVTGGVIATSFRADGDLEGKLGSSTGSEGTAMMEIVHDIAPGAQLRFANFNTDLEFNAAVDFLASVSDVVIDDISFFGGPYDQSSLVSSNTAAELQRLSNPIRGYYTSVGNSALNHYEEPFASGGACSFLTDASTCHLFAATADTTDAFSLGAIVANPILVPAGGTGVVELTWDDTFGSATSDYDLYLIDELTLQIVSQSASNNTTGNREPYEVVGVTNSTAAARWYDVQIVNYLGTQPAHRMELFAFGTAALPNGTELNFNTVRSSVTAQSDSGGGAVAVGAIAASDPGTDTIESFSSHGPTNNGVTKPDATAIDGVSVTGSGGFPATFFGTSAAAPHVAGLAALLLDKRPDLLSGEAGDDPAGDRAKLRAAIVDTAVDLGAAGVDNTYGSGRVNGLSAGQALDTDLSVAKSASPDPVVNGSDLTYVVTVSYNGPDNSTGVVLTDTLPQGVTFVTSTPGGPVCSESSATVTCDLGDLASGASTTVIILVSVNSATVITNTATVSGVEPDPELGNNTSAIATNVLAAPAVPFIPPWGMISLASAFGLFIWLRGRSARLAAIGRPQRASASRSRLGRRSAADRP